jgi:hypothetical protein
MNRNRKSKIPKGWTEIVNLRYQRDEQKRKSKIPKGWTEIVNLRYQRDE